MNILKLVLLITFVWLVSSCSSDNENLEKMIPADASGIISVNVPSLLKQSGCDGDLKIPAQLTDLVKDQDNMLSSILTDLPNSGIDFGDNLYVYFTQKTYRYVCLVALDDEDAAKAMIEKMTAQKFKEVSGIDYLRNNSYSFAIDDDVLFVGRENIETADNTLASVAKSTFDKSAKNILDVDDIKDCIHADNDINAYFDAKGLNAMLQTLPNAADIKSKFPLYSLFVDSDVKAYTLGMKFSDLGAEITVDVKATDNSEYAQLFKTLLAAPDNGFLKQIPADMKYLFAISLNGENLLKAGQIGELLNNTDLMGIDIRESLKTLNGPLAVAFSPSSLASNNSQDWKDWNMSVVFKSNNPNLVVSQITDFANKNGQPDDFMKNGCHVFTVEDKPLSLGVADPYVFANWLDYEVVNDDNYEGIPGLADRFKTCPIGLYLRCSSGKSEGVFNFGFESATKGKGIFYTSNEKDNPVVVFLGILLVANNSTQEINDEQNQDFNF